MTAFSLIKSISVFGLVWFGSVRFVMCVCVYVLLWSSQNAKTNASCISRFNSPPSLSSHSARWIIQNKCTFKKLKLKKMGKDRAHCYRSFSIRTHSLSHTHTNAKRAVQKPNVPITRENRRENEWKIANVKNSLWHHAYPIGSTMLLWKWKVFRL